MKTEQVYDLLAAAQKLSDRIDELLARMRELERENAELRNIPTLTDDAKLQMTYKRHGGQA